MERIAILNNLNKSIETLRITECNQKEKISHFHQISNCIINLSTKKNIKFSKNISAAINVLLLFCEDLDSLVRTHAEENLNKIIRCLEKTRISRVLYDISEEIKKNGNQRSLRICLKIFSYYTPQIKEKNIQCYALKLMVCIQYIAKRQEILLLETLCEFISTFSNYLQICLNDNETIKLIEAFYPDIKSDSAERRRYASKNCVSLIGGSRNIQYVSDYVLNKTLALLINDTDSNIKIGVFGLFRLLLPLLLAKDIADYKQIIEIFNLCLDHLQDKNHSVVNASLEVINAILLTSHKELEIIFKSNHLHHSKILKKRKLFRNQISKNSTGALHELACKKVQINQPNLRCGSFDDKQSISVQTSTLIDDNRRHNIINEPKNFTSNTDVCIDDNNLERCNAIPRLETSVNTINDFLSNPKDNEPNKEDLFDSNDQNVKTSLQLSDADNESTNSIEFDSQIIVGDLKTLQKEDNNKKEFVQSFLKNILPNVTTNAVTTLLPTQEEKLEDNLKTESNQKTQQNILSIPESVTLFENQNMVENLSTEDDAISLKSINSHISCSSHVSLQSITKDFLRSEQNLMLAENNDYEDNEDYMVKSVASPKIYLSDSSEINEHVFASIEQGIRFDNNIFEDREKIATSIDINIGNICIQNILYYTARLVASKFLLSGKKNILKSDTDVRVSIKNLSLNVIGNCIKYKPEILLLPLEMDELENYYENNLKITSFENESASSNCNSNDIEFDKERLDQDNFLEIKDDHFGVSITDNILDPSFLLLSKSLDHLDLKKQTQNKIETILDKDLSQKSKDINKMAKVNLQTEKILSKSEIIESGSYREYADVSSTLNMRTKMRVMPLTTKSNLPKLDNPRPSNIQQQQIFDIVLYHEHLDPILRGDIQMVVGNFIEKSVYTKGLEMAFDEFNGFNNIFDILIKGLQDSIHTVVIQALISFEKIFPILLLNSQNIAKNNLAQIIENNKELIEKLLIKLENCCENSYWRVVNKLGETISKLSFYKLKTCLEEDKANYYEDIFLNYLIKQLENDDYRIRDKIAESIIHYIKKDADMNFINTEEFTNFNLMVSFINHRVFRTMPLYIQMQMKSELPFGKNVKTRLSRILYIITNKLMEIRNKSLQIGLIKVINLLASHFNVADYPSIWKEFNLLEITMVYLNENFEISTDPLHQNEIIDTNAKLLAGNICSSGLDVNLINIFTDHVMKILNIFFHIFTKQKPNIQFRSRIDESSAKVKDKTIPQKLGYFSSKGPYIQIYKALQQAFENYKITINQATGIKLISLLKTSLNSLILLLELKSNKGNNIIKIIEEILLYLQVIVNYAPIETIHCLRQLFKYLFGRNYANRKSDYENIIQLFFSTKRFMIQDDEHFSKCDGNLAEYFGALCACTINFPLQNLKSEAECIKHIKLFEPLVIYCLTLYLKSVLSQQAAILDLLSQLCELNVTYSILDAKSIIFQQVINTIDLLEYRNSRNSEVIMPSIIKFLINLSKQTGSKLITIPKIISTVNNLLANNNIKESSILSLNELAFEVFFNLSIDSDSTENFTFYVKELNAQKEVVLGMIDKFINDKKCLKILAILLLWIKHGTNTSFEDKMIFQIVLKSIESGQILIQDKETFFIIDSIFRNCGNSILLESKNFGCAVEIFIKQNVENFNNLSLAIVILDNVILKTEDIYLQNHIKLFLKNIQETIYFDEINYFGHVLYKKLEACFSTLITYPHDKDYLYLTTKYIKALKSVSNLDALNSTLKNDIIDNSFWDRYNFFTIGMHSIFIKIFELFCVLNLDKLTILRYLENIENSSIYLDILDIICRKFDNHQWSIDELKLLFKKKFLIILLNSQLNFLFQILSDASKAELLVESLIDNDLFFIKENGLNVLLLAKEISINNFDLKLKLLVKLYSLDNFYINRQILFSVVNEIKSSQELQSVLSTFTENNFDDIFKYCTNISTNELYLTLKQITCKIIVLDATNNIKESTKKYCDTLDENWINDKIIEFSKETNFSHITTIIQDMKSESQIRNILSNPKFNIENGLKLCIEKGFKTLLDSFHYNCIQFNAHSNYLQVNILLKVATNILLGCIKKALDNGIMSYETNTFQIAEAAIVYMKNISQLEKQALLFIESKFIEKFICEQLLKAENLEIFINFALLCSQSIDLLLKNSKFLDKIQTFKIYFIYIDEIFKQQILWYEINQQEKYELHAKVILDTIFDAFLKLNPNIKFYKNNLLKINQNSDIKISKVNISCSDSREKAIFLGKLLESETLDTASKLKDKKRNLPLDILKSMTVSLLRTNYYYVYAVTPYELSEKNLCNIKSQVSNKLPSIPIEYLSDGDILLKFVKRLFIFGFSTRQQFEEYFMTFLLLINNKYDENMVDVQEQYQIKSISLMAIMELLLDCKTFPIIGDKNSRYHHMPRLPQILCKNISLKKLYKVQMIIPGVNIFYLPNLERNLSNFINNDAISTNNFLPNQYDINHMWQQMENRINESENKENIWLKNLHYFLEKSKVDLHSSCQLIFDVFTQLLEKDYSFVLPNLTKFCDICDNRDHIKWINEAMYNLHDQIPIDDTISHQYIIYILCKTHSILIPTYNEFTRLISIVGMYLKSTHIYLRNATLCGIFSLLECCWHTNTTIGKLGEELSQLRNLIAGYIGRYGFSEESPTIFSDEHTKLVWTLNFSLIEMTTKFVPECNLLSNTIISANNILKRTQNEDIYLCIIYGLERIILLNIGSKIMQNKIEKLALDLVKRENENFAMPALKLLVSCIYIDSLKQLEITEHSNGIVEDEPEIVAQLTEKIDILLHCIKSSTLYASKIYGDVLCQIIRDLVPPNEILTKVIKELLAINQPHTEVIAQVVFQVFRSAIDSSFLQMLQDWLICSLPNFIKISPEKGVWRLIVIFISASVNLNLVKIFPFLLNEFNETNEMLNRIFLTSACDFYLRLNEEQKQRFKICFQNSEYEAYRRIIDYL